jgi:hypothetical protein
MVKTSSDRDDICAVRQAQPGTVSGQDGGVEFEGERQAEAITDRQAGGLRDRVEGGRHAGLIAGCVDDFDAECKYDFGIRDNIAA